MEALSPYKVDAPKKDTINFEATSAFD